MFYDNMRTLQNFGELTWPQAQTIIIPSPTSPIRSPASRAMRICRRRRQTSRSISNATVNPYAHQFDIGINRLVTSEIAATVDFSIVSRYSDRDTVDVNLPDPVTRVRPYPQFGRVSFWQSTADNTYRALLLKVEKRMTHNYQFLASYTLAKAQDNGFLNSQADYYGYQRIERYGTADRRHRLVVSGIRRCPARRRFRRSAISVRACRSARAADSISTATATPVIFLRACFQAPAAVR